MPLLPLLQEWLDPIKLPSVLKVKTVVVVEVLCAWYQLLQGARPIFGQRKILDIADLASSSHTGQPSSRIVPNITLRFIGVSLE
jgi:hypothetical protein